MRFLILPVLAALAVSSPVLAQDASQAPDNPTAFATVDADGNGSVSFAELSTLLPDMTQDAFNAADTDHNGELSEDEYLVLLSAAAP